MRLLLQNLLSKFIVPYERYLWIGAVVALAIGGMVFIHHERGVGRQQIVAADKQARADEHVKIIAEETRLQTAADAAKAERDAKAKDLADYKRDHPVGAVRLCHPNNQPAGAGKVAAANPGDAGAGTGPAVVPEVLDGDSGEGPDVGPEIDALLSAAEKLGGLYRQYQQQPIPKSVN